MLITSIFGILLQTSYTQKVTIVHSDIWVHMVASSFSENKIIYIINIVLRKNKFSAILEINTSVNSCSYIQAEISRARVPMRSLHFSFDLFFSGRTTDLVSLSL
jgi:hypothetical protein